MAFVNMYASLHSNNSDLTVVDAQSAVVVDEQRGDLGGNVQGAAEDKVCTLLLLVLGR